MGGIIKSPKMPEQKETLPTLVDETRAVDEERERLAKRKGAAATLLAKANKPMPAMQQKNSNSAAAKTLLGQ